MPESTQQLRTVAWGELFPWLMLVRALRLATSAPLLMVATVAVLVMPMGWQLACWVQSGAAGPAMAGPRAEIVAELAACGAAPAGMLKVTDGRSVPPLTWPGSWDEFTSPMARVVAGGLQPVRYLFAGDLSWSELGVFAIGTLWNLLVWGFCGGIIVRTAVMRLGGDERVGLLDAARFAAGRYLALVGAPLFVLALIVLMALAAAPIGWLLRFEVGAFLAALVWVCVLLGGLLAAVAFAGLYFGWPLMWGALCTEEMGDVFEATQRSFSYTFGHPLRYAWYALVTLLVGSAAYVVVQWLAALTVHMSFWLVSWGSGAHTPLADVAGPWRAASVAIISWCSQLAFAVGSAFRYAYFWCAAGAAYLLLRRDCDQIDFDVIHRPDQPLRDALPHLTPDEPGEPGVA